MKYNAGDGASANWIVEETAFDPKFQGKCESIMCQGNGYLGCRAATEERYPGQVRNTFIAGTFNRFHESEVTELPNIPDVTSQEIKIGDRAFSLEHGEMQGYARFLNLEDGVLTREVDWVSPDGEEVSLSFNRFVSAADQHLLAMRTSIRAVNCDISLQLTTGIDGQVTNSGTQHFAEGEKRIYDKRFVEQIQTTIESGIHIVILAGHRFLLDGVPQDFLPRMLLDRRQTWMQFDIVIPTGSTLVIEKQSRFYTSLDKRFGHQPELPTMREEALAEMRETAEHTYDDHLDKHTKSWHDYWSEVGITIDGDNFDQLAVRFAQYHLRSFTPVHDPRFGIGAKGLSGEGYKGHSFWDTEIFCLPFFIFTMPEVARSLLTYRYLTLNGARKKARDNGYQGAMYPWESARTGEEVTPVWGGVDIVTGQATKIWTGFIEQHITADISYTIGVYHRVTGDDAFMDAMGYEILFDTATFWTSRLQWQEDRAKWGICDVIGPDEYKEHIDNNAFTNHMAEHNIRLAMTYYEALSKQNAPLLDALEEKIGVHENYRFWCARIDDIYLPQPREEDGVVPQDDTYLQKEIIDLRPYKQQDHVGSIHQKYNLEQLNQIQVSKQADIMALFLLLPDRFNDELMRANWNYYEPKTLHDSSLSLSTHVVLATRVGDLPLAMEMFTRAARIDLGPDMKTSDHGIHAASIGGIWQSVVLGFGGLRMENGELHIQPVLPPHWNRLAYPVVWQGNRLDVSVEGRKVRVSCPGPKSHISIRILGEEHRITDAVREVTVG